MLAGRPMLEWSVDALRAAGLSEIVVALPEGEAAPPGCVGVRRWRDPVGVRARGAGGGRRGRDVVVHDAARPLVEPALFTAALAALEDAERRSPPPRRPTRSRRPAPDHACATLDRSRLWAIQTPQAFRRRALERALDVGDDVLAQATDDAWLVERAGGSVVVVPSTPANFKVTTPHDLTVAELLLSSRSSG